MDMEDLQGEVRRSQLKGNVTFQPNCFANCRVSLAYVNASVSQLLSLVQMKCFGFLFFFWNMSVSGFTNKYLLMPEWLDIVRGRFHTVNFCIDIANKEFIRIAPFSGVDWLKSSLANIFS